ncbi:hypothetical protein M0657_000085 [Pyricularia oryzae]|uniref:Uncharacterized protein n=1 Tax=Pyricularia oryzae TaxID=318829 RepID=A0A4V1C5F2_PYROR|nr:hypothetical protein M9X92_000036 [Pyricularia oryzae]KAI7932776.1 hypothetical protein M0657_000085 [Pyricularia oryzae]QBZ56175.1 hypothetical protein PoMZ_01081 [Pyricularia oryzae]
MDAPELCHYGAISLEVGTEPQLWDHQVREGPIRRPSIENNMDVCEDGKDAEGFIAAKLRKGNGLFKGAEDIRAVWSID